MVDDRIGTVEGTADTAAPRSADPPRTSRPRRRRRAWYRAVGLWLPLLPFFAFTTVFLFIPTGEIVVQAFRTTAGAFTLDNVHQLTQSQDLDAFKATIKISLITAVLGGFFGLFVAQAALGGALPNWLRPIVVTFAGVASNFAGVPLAFAFIATLGATGALTSLLSHMGVDLYGSGFTIYGTLGLSITYLYFQFPLMVLIIAPAIDNIRDEWREAAVNLGASSSQYWRMVVLPVLWPSLLGAIVLLFGNAFSAYATPYALSSGYINLVPVLIGEVVNGDVASNPQLGDALALGMIVVIGVVVVIYGLLQRRAMRWQR